MAIKKGHEVAIIDTELVVVETEDGVELGLTTSNKVQVDPEIKVTDAIQLIIKGRLESQKRKQSTLTGNTITLTDNVFNFELVKIFCGGTIEYNSEGKPIKYTPPVAGADIVYKPFKLTLYSAHYNAAGLIVDHVKVTYPNCTGDPISISTEDDVFSVQNYNVYSAPDEGEPPFIWEMVEELPKVEGFLTLDDTDDGSGY